jgi:hypothetical protein
MIQQNNAVSELTRLLMLAIGRKVAAKAQIFGVSMIYFL